MIWALEVINELEVTVRIELQISFEAACNFSELRYAAWNRFSEERPNSSKSWELNLAKFNISPVS